MPGHGGNLASRWSLYILTQLGVLSRSCDRGQAGVILRKCSAVVFARICSHRVKALPSDSYRLSVARCSSSLVALQQQHRVEIKGYLKVRDRCAKAKINFINRRGSAEHPGTTQREHWVADSSSEGTVCHSDGHSGLRDVPGMRSRTGLKWWFTNVRPLHLPP